jgi:outer membrane lipoprotein-sorting protein
VTDFSDDYDRLIDTLLDEAAAGQRPPDLTSRILARASDTRKAPTADPPRPGISRPTISRWHLLERVRNMNRSTKLSSAAAVVMALAAAVIGVFFSSPGSGVAFAAARDKLEKARTASFLVTTETAGNGNPQVLETTKVFVRDPGLVRLESQTTGITMLVSVEDGTMLMLLPPQKKAVIVDPVGPAVLEPFRGFFLDALRKQFDCANKPLGEQVVNGRQATGLGGIWRPEAGTSFPEFPVEVWVDSATGELVRIVMLPNHNMRSVIDTFVLDPAVDDSLFSLEPPEGYEVETKKLPQVAPPGGWAPAG